MLEGLDGSGLTTQAALLRDWLTGREHPRSPQRAKRRPGGCGRALGADAPPGLPAARQHGAAEAAPGAWEPLGDEVLALLYAADRLDHVRQEVAPRLARGVTVVCDRYRCSSLAYQALGADEAWVAALNSNAAPGPDHLPRRAGRSLCPAWPGWRGTVELYEEPPRAAASAPTMTG